jgi:hypothetical protein
LDFDNIIYYAKPKIGSKIYANDWNDVPEEIKSTFLKL